MIIAACEAFKTVNSVYLVLHRGLNNEKQAQALQDYIENMPQAANLQQIMNFLRVCPFQLSPCSILTSLLLHQTDPETVCERLNKMLKKKYGPRLLLTHPPPHVPGHVRASLLFPSAVPVQAKLTRDGPFQLGDVPGIPSLNHPVQSIEESTDEYRYLVVSVVSTASSSITLRLDFPFSVPDSSLLASSCLEYLAIDSNSLIPPNRTQVCINRKGERVECDRHRYSI